MSVTYQDILEHVNGELVAGSLLARVDGRNEVLGLKAGNQFTLTARGEEVAAEIAALREKRRFSPLDHDHNGRKGGVAKNRKAAAEPKDDVQPVEETAEEFADDDISGMLGD